MLPNRTLILALTILVAILCTAYITVVHAAQIDNVTITVTQPPPSKVYQNQIVYIGVNVTNNNPLYNANVTFNVTGVEEFYGPRSVIVPPNESKLVNLKIRVPGIPGKYNTTLYAKVTLVNATTNTTVATYNWTKIDTWLITVKKIVLNVTVTPIGYLVVKGVHGSEICFDIKANSTVAGTYNVNITVPPDLTIVDFEPKTPKVCAPPACGPSELYGRFVMIRGLQKGEEIRLCLTIKLSKGSRPGFYYITINTTAPRYEKFDYPILVVNESKNYSISINVEPKYGKYYANYTITATIRAEAYPRVQRIPDIIINVTGPDEAHRVVSISWSKYAPKVNVELKVLAKGKYVKSTPTLAVYNYTDFLLSGSKTISAPIIGKENAKVLKECPNVTIIVTVNDNVGLKASSTIYRVLDFRGPIVKFEVKPAVNVSGIYWINKSSVRLNITLNISTFVSEPYVAKILRSGFKLYINNTKRPVECKIVSTRTIDESGKNITVVLCTFDVEKNKLLFNVGLKVCDSVGRCVWVNRTGPLKIERDITPPSKVKFGFNKMFNYIENITASDNQTGIYGYNITIIGSGKLTKIVNKTCLEAKKYVVFFYGAKKPIDLSKLLSVSAVDYGEVWKNILEHGAVIVGYGRVYIIPPGLETKAKVIIRAVDYSGNQGPESTITISYNSSARPDTFAIIYIHEGWNIFAVPGLLDKAGIERFSEFITKYIERVPAACIITGVYNGTIEPCIKYIKNPVIVRGSKIRPVIFIMHIDKLEKPELLILPVYFRTLSGIPTPLMITVNVKPGMWTFVPAALNYAIQASVSEMVHSSVQMNLVVYAYDSIKREFRLVGVKYSGESRFARSMYVPLGTLMLLSSTVGGTVTITPVFYSS